MIFEELEQRYGPYLAEMVRQSMTLDEFARLEIEELGAYYALRSARAYQEYIEHEGTVPPSAMDGRSVLSESAYDAILRRRWQQAEELAQAIMKAERDLAEDSGMMAG